MSTISVGDIVKFVGPDPGWGPAKHGKVTRIKDGSVDVEIVAGGHAYYDAKGSTQSWGIFYCEAATVPSKDDLDRAYATVQARHEWEDYARRTGQTVEQVKAPLFSAILGVDVEPKNVPTIEYVSDVMASIPGMLAE